jgi:RNA polymerase sigma-70 factor (ECF subfamily)
MPNTDPITDLYRRHAPAVFRRARQILGIEADAHEVVQEVFLSLVERPEQFDGRSAMTTFLYAVTTHACLNRIRNRNNRSRLERQQWPTPELDERDRRLSPEQLLMLHRALERMPGDMADASIYYFVDGLTHHEISQLLGCSRRHVGDLLERISRWGSEETSC